MHQSLLTTGQVPYWTDLIGNGYPIYAEGQMGALYPFHYFFFSLPFKTISLFNSNLILHFVLTSIFIYQYTYKYIKTNKYVSLLASLVFAFSGYMLTHLHQVNIILVITYLPLNFYLIEKIFELKKNDKLSSILKLFLFTTIVLYAQITAGHIEMVYYNFLFTAVYLILRLLLDKDVRKFLILRLSIIVAAGVLSVILALPQILATYELVNFSQREEGLSYEHSTGALWPVETMSLFINPKAFDVYRKEPGYSPVKSDTINIGAVYPYVGIVPLILSLVAFASLFKRKSMDNNPEYKSKKKMWITFFFLLLSLTYLYAVGRSTQLFAVVWEIIPGLKYFRYPIKALYVIEFSIAILSTLGLQETYDYIIDKSKKKGTKDNQNNQNLTTKSLQAGWSSTHSSGNFAGKNILAIAVVALLITVSYADLWINNRPIQPTIQSEDWLQTPEFAKYIKDQELEDNQNNFVNWRSYSHGTNNIDYARIFDFNLQKELRNILHIDFNIVHGIAVNREWAVLFLQRQTQLNKFNTTINFEKGQLGLPDKMKKSLDLQSVRYLLTDIPIIHPDIILQKEITLSKPVDHVVYLANTTDAQHIPVSKLYLYENTTYFNRINITPQKAAIKIFPTDKYANNVLETALSEEFDPSKQTIIEAQSKEVQNSDLPEKAEQFFANYQIQSYTPENIKINVNSNEPSYLSIEDTYYPGWKATVDGKDTTIYKANYAFRAVEVDSGEHLVEMKFQPEYLNTGGIIQKTGWGIVGFLTILTLFLSFKNKK